MAEPELLLRFTCKVGRLRISFRPSTTLAEVKKSLAEQLQVPVDEIAMTTDAKGACLLSGDQKPLSKFHLKSGDMLYVHVRSEATMTSSFPVQSTRMFNAISDLPSQPTPSQHTPKEAPVTSQPSSSALRSSKQKPPPSEAISPTGRVKTPNESSASTPSGSGEGGPSPNDPKFLPFEYFLKQAEFNVINLPLSRNYKCIRIEKGAMIKIPASETLKHQAYRHVDHIEIANVKDMTGFVNYWRHELSMLQQRAGLLIGYYRNDPHYKGCGMRAVVEGIYEPPQVTDGSAVDILDDDPFLPQLMAILSTLGLEIIGMIFTHLPRERLLTAAEALKIAKMQWQFCHPGLHYTGYTIPTAVTITVSPDSKGEPALNAFMISDLGMAFLRDEVIQPVSSTDESSMVVIKERGPNEVAPQILESGNPATKFDVDWLIVRVNDSAPIKPKCFFSRNDFTKQNRLTHPQQGECGRFVKSAPKSGTTRDRFADLSFIIYVANIIGLESAMTICECIRSNTPLAPEFIQLLETL